jgi:hypothetical protein
MVWMIRDYMLKFSRVLHLFLYFAKFNNKVKAHVIGRKEENSAQMEEKT